MTTVPLHTDSLVISTKTGLITEDGILSHSMTVWLDTILVYGDVGAVLRAEVLHCSAMLLSPHSKKGLDRSSRVLSVWCPLRAGIGSSTSHDPVGLSRLEYECMSEAVVVLQ